MFDLRGVGRWRQRGFRLPQIMQRVSAQLASQEVLGPPGLGWAPSADGRSWPVCLGSGCFERLPPSLFWGGLCSICARLEMLRAECGGLSKETSQARTIEQLLDVCIRLANEGVIDAELDNRTASDLSAAVSTTPALWG